MSSLSDTLLSWLGAAGDGGAPAAAPLAWTAVAASRRELGGRSSTVKPAATTTSSDPVTPVSVYSPAVSAIGKAAAANPFQNFIRIFIGNGTAENPDAGLLIGNGFSWDATTCNQGVACRGGQAGLLFGNGGNGFNGGSGGSSFLFGDGGAGGAGIAGVNNGLGGSGGLAGVLWGNGGAGGAGAA
ncbi:MAG: hypothetical protein FGM52_04585, partial [Mycobacterium sp.]|nr:hypothetical protein [Mycobacterium sp.]